MVKIKRICPICNKSFLLYPSRIKKENCCSRKCANKLHEQRMRGKGNPRYGKPSWSHGLTKKDSKGLQSTSKKLKGEQNPNWKGSFRGKKLWSDCDKQTQEAARKKISKAHKGKKYDYHNRSIRSIYGKEGFIDSNYRRHLPKTGSIGCECCGKEIKIGTRAGIYVHHKDQNKQNNDRNNLSFVCPKCHNIIHHGGKKNDNVCRKI